MKMNQKAFSRGVDNVMRLRPLRRWLADLIYPEGKQDLEQLHRDRLMMLAYIKNLKNSQPGPVRQAP